MIVKFPLPAFCTVAALLVISVFTGMAIPSPSEGKKPGGNVLESLLSESIQSAKTAEKDWEEEFEFLEHEIKQVGEGWFNLERLRKEAARVEAVYHEQDKTPSDIILRRTKALLAHLGKSEGNRDAVSKASAELAEWENKRSKDPSADRETLMREFKELCRIRRSLAFSNPLLDFDKITFLTHYSQRQGKGEIHIVDQYLGFNARPGGAPYILENPFSDAPTARRLLDNTTISNGRRAGEKLENGSFLSLDLGYDSDKLFFAWTQAVSTQVTGQETWEGNFGNPDDLKRLAPSYYHYYWAPDRVYHIYSVDLKSGELKQLTDGCRNAYDPCELPGGRLVYISESASNQRCGGRWISAGVLHSMEQDGSDSYPLSFHETNEWHPSVTNDGMIIYSRWDYVDRDDCGAHHLWKCYPDGRDPRAPHGNYAKERELRPFAELSYRAIPGSGKLVAVSTAHHGIAYGSLILVDPSLPDDGAMSQVKRLTPEALFQESEKAPGYPHPLARTNSHPNAEFYGTPWPLSEDFFLCVYARNKRDYGIYLVDSFGNRELIWQDREVPCLDPIPFKPRKRPPVIPDMTSQSIAKQAAAGPVEMAEVFVDDVYKTERPLPEGVRIKWLRVVNIFSKTTVHQNEPNIGMAHQSLARGSLGLAPVEDDGSVFFKMPSGANVYFQLLDENMQAVHSMRSSTYAHPGERLSCIGCHENKAKDPVGGRLAVAKAIKRAPSDLMAEPDGSFPLTFPRLVQPVLDRNCVACHAREQRAPALDGRTWRVSVNKETGAEERHNVAHGWSNAFMSLHNWGWGRHGGNGSHWRQNKFTYTVPGDVGAKASRLIPFLQKGHHGVSLNKEDWHRLSLWIDLNTNFYGAYENTEAQAKGELVLPKSGMAKHNPLTVKNTR